MRTRFRSRICLLLALGALPSGCALPPPFGRPAVRPEPTSVEVHIEEIDRLTWLGRIREAIDRAELALIDHHESETLRDRLAELRSIRQVMYQETIERAGVLIEQGSPRTALAVLRKIDGFGDDDMVRTARNERRSIIAAHPAIFREDWERERIAGPPESGTSPPERPD